MENKIVGLRYGSTNTYFVSGLLIDTDMAGRMPAFRKECKEKGIRQEEIRFLLATHFHPDHMGLIGELTKEGAKLILLPSQKDFVHFSDELYARMPASRFLPIDEKNALVLSPEESRAFLRSVGIEGQILPTKSHSPDGAALLLDDGTAIVGDLEPMEYLAGYPANAPLKEDWETLLAAGAKRFRFGHIPDRRI